MSAAALSTAPGRRLPSSRPAAAPLVVVPPRWDQPDKAARVIHGGAALWVGKNASVGTLQKAISRVVDDHGYRAGARRMAAALAAGRGDGLIAGEPGAAAELVVPALPRRGGSTMGTAAAITYCRMMASTVRRPVRVWLAPATCGG